MASMGLSRLDDLSLRTQYSQAAETRLRRLLPRVLVCSRYSWLLHFAVYYTGIVSEPVVESILFRLPARSFGQPKCEKWALHQFKEVGVVLSATFTDVRIDACH